MSPRHYLEAALSGIILFFIFPNALDLELWPLAWVALVPLITVLDKAKSTRQAAMLASVTGLVANPLIYHWVIYCMHTYAQMGYAASAISLMAMVVLLTCFFTAFGALYHALTKKFHCPAILAAPLAWTALEFLRAHFPFGGFPWALLAYSQHKFLPIIQIADITGPYGITFIILLANTAIAQTIINLTGSQGARVPSPARSARSTPARSARAFLPLLLGLGIPLLALIYGLARIAAVDRAFSKQPQITVGIVQANIDQGEKWSRESFWNSMEKHLDLTRSIMKDKPRIVIWPEASVTVSAFNEHWAKRSTLINFLSKVDTFLLTGSLSSEACPDKKPSGDEPAECHFNSAYLLSPKAEDLLGRYDKMRLVPFGEYVPLSSLLFFADAIARGNTGSTTAGARVEVMSIPEAQFGCVICYEVVFPGLVRKFVNEGADFMTTITNDAWFGKTGAPYQHHSTVIFRAVENRVYFARSANTGISSVVDPTGRVVHATEIYTPAAFTETVRPSPLSTFYTKSGDVFAWLVTACIIVIVGYGLILTRKKREGE